jgi:hypothetical protein
VNETGTIRRQKNNSLSNLVRCSWTARLACVHSHVNLLINVSRSPLEPQLSPPARDSRGRCAARGWGEKGVWISSTSVADGFPFGTDGTVKPASPISAISPAVKLGK